MAVDLHVHTTASDGTFTPTQAVSQAAALGLRAIAITDHDTTAGIKEAVAYSSSTTVEVVSAVELSTTFGGADIHLLLYFIDPGDSRLVELLSRRRALRHQRLIAILDRLALLGLDLSIDDVVPSRDSDSSAELPLGRAHIAYALQARGLVGSVQEAFDLYLARGKAAYVSLEGLPSEEVLALSKDMGSIASLAHPALSVGDGDIEKLARCGLPALEVRHSDHPIKVQRHYEELAAESGLLPTGGSDCHGPGSGRQARLGSVSVPDSYLRDIRAATSARS